MPEPTNRPQAGFEPTAAWTVLTDSPLKGLALAREAATILAWDEGEQAYLLDVRGGHRSVSRIPGRISAGTISDDGTLVTLLIAGPRLLFLDADLGVIADRSAPSDPSAIAGDPHGRYVAVASRSSTTYLYTRHGRQAGRFETRQGLAHLTFIPSRPFLLGAAAFGLMVGVELRPIGGSTGRLSAEIEWQEAVLSNVGRLTCSGDGGMILASCYTHGLQRYDLRGHNEGAYHLGGTVAHAIPDFAGRLIAVATLEGELVILSPGGHVRWRTGLARPALALEVDPLGRFLIYGHATGEIVRLDLEPTGRGVVVPDGAAARAGPGHPEGRDRAGAGTAGPAVITGARSIRKPAWSVPVATTDERAETAVVTVLDDPPRIGVFTAGNRLQVFTQEGKNLGLAPEILGMGRILRAAPGWIAAATDRQILLYDARRNATSRLDLSLVEVTHLAIRPDAFGLAIVQERDRVGRYTPAARTIWKKELSSPVEDLAIGPDGYLALTRDDGRFEVYDAAGAVAGGYSADPSEPLCLIEAPEATPPPVIWLTLARRSQVVRGHDLLGRVVWQAPVPWEGWQFHRLGRNALINAPDGRALAIDGAGQPRAQGRANDGAVDVFGATTSGEPVRVTRQGVHLISADLSGQVRWRTVSDEPFGPFAVSPAGVAILIGRSLAWFPDPRSAGAEPVAKTRTTP